MLNKIKKKHGFTLVEVLIAFVIFAIMAAMVSSIVQTTMRAKQRNLENDASIEAQRRAYYQKELPQSKDDYDSMTSASGAYKGNVKLDFGAKGDIDVDFVAADPTGTADPFELEYYVGEYGNDLWKKTSTNDNAGGDGSGSVLNDFNCGIYGSAGFDSVQVGVQKRNDMTNSYLIYVSPKGKSNDLNAFMKLELTFPSEVKNFKAWGANGQENGTAAADITRNRNLNTIRISGDGSGNAIINRSIQMPVCWVELAEPLTSEQLGDLNKLFGTSGSATVETEIVTQQFDSYPTDESTFKSYKFVPFVDSKNEEHINIYAATEKPKEEESK